MGNRFPKSSRRATTINDVASAAGVSKATVSKYLGEGDYYVAEATRAKIAAAIAELDYRPNTVARSLVSRRTHTVGVVVASVTNPLYPDLIAGVDEILGREGYTLIFGSTEGSAAQEAAVIRSMQQRQVDGIILASVTLHDGQVGQLVDAGLDVVLASRHLKLHDVVDAVVIDNEDGARLATEHLIAHGHKRIGHIAGPQDIYPFEIRRKTFEQVLSQAGLTPHEVVAAATLDQDAGAEALRALLALPEPPTAVFTANDRLAIGVIEECAARGLRTPDDLAVVGFDNIWVAGIHGVQLSTVDSRARDIGRGAAQRLIAKIDRRWTGDGRDGIPPHTEVLSTRLIRRATCGCHPTKD